MSKGRSAMCAAASLLLLLACGSSGGGSHPPNATNLYLSGRVVVDGVTGSASVYGSLDFTDAGGDLAYLVISSPGFGSSTTPISGAAGVTAGSGHATLTLAASAYGDVPFQVWLVDQAGESSNHLSGKLSLVPEDDGARWTQVSALPAKAIVSAPGSGHAAYVAVGSGGLILSSQDGSVWTQQASPVSTDLTGVAWSGSRFVAVGKGATILTSNDGFAWTAQSAPIMGAALTAVAWANDAFLAVGGPDSPPGSGDWYPAVALRSSDGLAWTVAVLPDSSGHLYDVAFGAGRWVAVGEEAWSSADGSTWTKGSGSHVPSVRFAVGWNGTRFLAVGTVGTWQSADGLAWTENLTGTGAPAGFNYFGLAWSGYRWLALSGAANDAAVSTDGLSWVDHWGAPSAQAKVIWDGTRFPSRYLAAGGGIWTSP